jgi:hypothetical protein
MTRTVQASSRLEAKLVWLLNLISNTPECCELADVVLERVHDYPLERTSLGNGFFCDNCARSFQR